MGSVTDLPAQYLSQDSRPNDDQIMTDLLQKSLYLNNKKVWNFDFISEFKRLQVQQITKLQDYIEMVVDMDLKGYNENYMSHAKIIISYNTIDGRYQFREVRTISYNRDN